jgi:hypothetical protein
MIPSFSMLSLPTASGCTSWVSLSVPLDPYGRRCLCTFPSASYRPQAPQTIPRMDPTIAPGRACSCIPATSARPVSRIKVRGASHAVVRSNSGKVPCGMELVYPGVPPRSVLVSIPNIAPRTAPVSMRPGREARPEAAGRLPIPHMVPHTAPHTALPPACCTASHSMTRLVSGARLRCMIA